MNDRRSHKDRRVYDDPWHVERERVGQRRKADYTCSDCFIHNHDDIPQECKEQDPQHNPCGHFHPADYIKSVNFDITSGEIDMTFKDQLIVWDANKDFIEWTGDKTLEEVWLQCQKGTWMLWLYAKMFPNGMVMLLNEFMRLSFAPKSEIELADWCRDALTSTVCIQLGGPDMTIKNDEIPDIKAVSLAELACNLGYTILTYPKGEIKIVGGTPYREIYFENRDEVKAYFISLDMEL